MSQLGLSPPSSSTRIVPVCGDLSLPRLGLTEEAFDDLAQRVGTIFHSGAVVNHVRPYDALRPANVMGTSEILRFAVRHRVKPVHYLSTIAVLSGAAHRALSVLHESPLDHLHDDLPGSYAKTKWVAERLMSEAAARGVPVTIYRLGQVTGDTVNGKAQTGDFIARFLEGCLQLGATISSDMPIDLVPVDFVARSIVGIAQRPAPAGPDVIHLVTPIAPTWRTLLGMLRRQGYDVDELPFDEWYARLLAAARAGHDNALIPYIAMIDEAHPVMTRVPRFDCTRARDRMAVCGITYPPIDEAYVSKVLAFYVANGVMHKAPTPVAARAG